LGNLTAMVLMVIATLIALSIIWGTYVLRLKMLHASTTPSPIDG
jgi:hypothetical protein